MAEKIFAESGGSEYFLNLVIAGAVAGIALVAGKRATNQDKSD